MKKLTVIFQIALASVLLMAGCNKETNGPNDIRIKNISGFTYTDVFVDSSEGQNDYGTIAAGATTDYKRFPLAFNRAYIQLNINGVLHKTDTLNFTALVPLVAGRVTYSVDADTATRKVTMELTEILPF